MQEVSKKRVGILRGGMGDNYNSSLKKGGDIILHIHENLSDKYKPIDILIDKDHVWHVNGMPINPGDLVSKIDIAWNTTHPSISNVLSSLSIPSVGNGSFSSALENSKEMLKAHMQKLGVSMPRSIVLPVYQADFDGPRERYSIKKAKEIHAKFCAPWVVKSFTSDANMGIHLAKTFPQLVNAIEDGVNHDKSILVEEFISGKVAAVHSIKNFRDQDVYTFPLGNTFGNFSTEEKDKLDNLVRQLHDNIGSTHYLKSDFVMNKRGKIYILGINNIPNLKDSSHFSEVCDLVGVKPHHIVDHILESVLK